MLLKDRTNVEAESQRWDVSFALDSRHWLAILFYLRQWTHLSAAEPATSAGRLHTSGIQNMHELLRFGFFFCFVFFSLVPSGAIMKWDKASPPGDADASRRRLKVIQVFSGWTWWISVRTVLSGMDIRRFACHCVGFLKNSATWQSSTHRSFDCPDSITTGFTKGLNPLAHQLDTHQCEPGIWGCSHGWIAV